MTNIEVQALTIVKIYVPQIAKSLGRIANALEDANSLKRLELIRRDGLDLDELDMEDSK